MIRLYVATVVCIHGPRKDVRSIESMQRIVGSDDLSVYET